jgi:hypothetical protein
VAAALSNLIQATTHASGRSPNDPAIGNLKEAAKVSTNKFLVFSDDSILNQPKFQVMVSNVSGLLRAIKTVEDSSQRGAQALEASINAIELAIKAGAICIIARCLNHYHFHYHSFIISDAI